MNYTIIYTRDNKSVYTTLTSSFMDYVPRIGETVMIGGLVFRVDGVCFSPKEKEINIFLDLI